MASSSHGIAGAYGRRNTVNISNSRHNKSGNKVAKSMRLLPSLMSHSHGDGLNLNGQHNQSIFSSSTGTHHHNQHNNNLQMSNSAKIKSAHPLGVSADASSGDLTVALMASLRTMQKHSNMVSLVWKNAMGMMDIRGIHYRVLIDE